MGKETDKLVYYEKNIEIMVLFLLLFLPSLRVIYKYLPYPEPISISIGAVLALFYFFIFNNQILNRLFNSRTRVIWFIFIVLSIFIIVNYFIYPIADARKFIGKGSTGDDAIIEAARQFYLTGNMYDIVLQGNAPVSPGPGWILLNSLFVYNNCYFLLTPTYILFSILVYSYLFKLNSAPVLILLLLSTCLIFWELMVTGHDLIALGVSFTIIMMLLYYYCIEIDIDLVSMPIFLVSILIGIIATSRVIFIFLPLLCGLLIFKFKPKLSLFIVVISMVTAIIFHVIFYLKSNIYQPLHLFGRGESHVGFPIIILGALLTAILAIVAYFRINKTLDSFSGWFFILIATPLAFISFGEYLFVGKSFAAWEGANYLMPAIPPYLVFISNKYAFRMDKDAKV